MLLNIRCLKKPLAIEEPVLDLSVRGNYLVFNKEAWLYENMDLSQTWTSNYKTYRQGRKTGKSKKSVDGGVPVYVQSTKNSKLLTIEVSDVFDLKCLQLVINGTFLVFNLLFYPFL